LGVKRKKSVRALGRKGKKKKERGNPRIRELLAISALISVGKGGGGRRKITWQETREKKKKRGERRLRSFEIFERRGGKGREKNLRSEKGEVKFLIIARQHSGEKKGQGDSHKGGDFPDGFSPL